MISPNDVKEGLAPICNEFTIRDPINPEDELIVVVERPPCKVVKLAPETTKALLWVVVAPVVVNAVVVTLSPAEAVIKPPTLRAPKSDAEPTVREPIYALELLIVVVDKPPWRVVKPETTTVLELIELVLIELAIISPIFKYPFVVPNTRELTLRLEIKPNWELIVVVDKPPPAVSKPPK